jgi:hypothetical protein
MGKDDIKIPFRQIMSSSLNYIWIFEYVFFFAQLDWPELASQPIQNHKHYHKISNDKLFQ